MSRRKKAEKRVTIPDPRYGHPVMSKFINCLMLKGEKSIAEKTFYVAIDRSALKLGVEPVEVFGKVIGNVKPMVEVRSRRVGGATYQVPMEVRPERSVALAIRWIIDAARKRSGRSMSEKLSDELTEAYHNKGAASKKREDTHKMAEANRAFAHFRFVGGGS